MTTQVDHQARQELLQQLRSSGDPQALQKAEQLQQLYHDRELAGLGADIYEAARGEGEPPLGWLRGSEHLDKLREYAPQLTIGDKELLDLLKPRESGFRAEIYLPDPAVLGPGYLPVVSYKGSAGMVQDANAPGGLRKTAQEDFLANVSAFRC